MPITITFRNLPLPCPINGLYRALVMHAKGRSFSKMVLTKRARDRKALVVAAMLEQMGGVGPRLDRPCQVSVVVTPRDRRTPDGDAHIKQLFDCLQAAGVITDDKLIVQHAVERMPCPQAPGHIDLELWELP